MVFLGRPGGMRWPPGGIIGGAKNSLFEICRYLRHVRALRFGGLEFGLDIWSSVQHALLRPSGAGGGLTSPRGITAARPPFFILRFGARPLGYVDFGDLKSLLCLLEPLGVSWRVLSPLDRLLGSLGLLLRPPGALLGASWSLLGGSWGGLGASWAALGAS